MFDPVDYFDSEYDVVRDKMQTPKWYVVRIVGNNSRTIIAVFDEDGEQEACRLCANDSELRLIPYG